MEDRLLAEKKTRVVDTIAPETVYEYTEEQIKEIHEKYGRIIKTMHAHGVMADTKLINGFRYGIILYGEPFIS